MSERWPFGSLTPFKYGAILADPPWAYEMYSAKGYGKSPEKHYSTMTYSQLAALPVDQLAAPDCILFLWAVWPKVDTALQLMREWGFTFKTGGAWHKTTRNGKTAFGTGYIFRSACEPFLVGTRGSPRTVSRSLYENRDLYPPLERVIVFSRRPSMPPGALLVEHGEAIRGGGSKDYCWIVWRKHHRAPPIIEWAL